MQVTPMWMPMTMPVVDVWLVASSFRQSHGGLRAGGQKQGQVGGCGSQTPSLRGLPLSQLLPPPSPHGVCPCLWDPSPTFLVLFTND